MAEETTQNNTVPSESIAERTEDEKILARARMQESDEHVGLIIDDSDEAEEIPDKPEDTHEYHGNGVVLDKKVTEKEPDPLAGAVGLNKNRMGDIEKRLGEMDDKIEEQRKIAEERIKKGDAPNRAVSDPNAPEAVRENNRRLREEEEAEATGKKKEETNTIDPKDTVQVIIDKSGLGKFEFTEEEKKRIETSRRIHLIEVEDKELKTITVKRKISKSDDFNILKRNFNKSYANVVALASGYTCKMKNVSAAEAIRMYQRPGQDTANSLVDKWSVVYDKITDISCGAFKDFEDFTHNTAFMDYESFLYGMICSSYPDDDSIEFTCQKDNGGCGKDFTVKYNNREMIRQSSISDGQKEQLARIVNNAPFVDKAKEVADNSPVHITKRFRIDDASGIIVEAFVPSVHDMIERVFRRMEENKDLVKQNNRNAVVLGQSIKNIYVPDYDEFEKSGNLQYFNADTLDAIVDILNQMNESQLQVVATRIDKMTSPYLIRFGFEKVECPHCHHDWGTYDMDLDNILFLRVQQRMSTEID